MLGMNVAHQNTLWWAATGRQPYKINHQSVIESAYSAIIQGSSLLYVHCSQERKDKGFLELLKQ